MLFNSNVHLVKRNTNEYNIILGNKDKSFIIIGHVTKAMNTWMLYLGEKIIFNQISSPEEAFKAFELLCYPKES